MDASSPGPRFLSQGAKKLAAVLIFAFALLFVIRFITGFFIDYDRSVNRTPMESSPLRGRFSDIEYSKTVSSNVAQLELAMPAASGGLNFNLIEVFAKEARLRSATGHFEDDETKTRSAIDRNGGLVRIEQKSGLKPDRTLQLVVRVPETKFDDLVGELQKIGATESFDVSKEDKSEEAKQLLVERKSLETYRDALVALRKAEGKVEEFVALEEKVQEVQSELEALEAKLGGYTGKESFNNVSFDLGERITFYVDEDRYPFGIRLLDALLWTIQYYLLGVFLTSVLGMTVWSARILFGKPKA